MTIVTTRQTTATGASNKSAPLSNAEVDNNFIDLNLNKFEKDGDTHITFTNSGTPVAVGKMVWDDGEGTVTLGLKGGNVNLQLGQEQVALCYNGTGQTITNGQVVYITGAQGQRPSIALAQASQEAQSSKTFGIATETIANGAEGFVATFGIVNGIDTSAFAEGQALWLSTTAGALTTTKPTQPNHLVFVGYCLKSNAQSGRIFVNPQNGYEVDELHDVLISGIVDNDVLVYEAATQLWKNKQLTLGTHTAGNYVASVATTAPLSGGAAGQEGGALTLSLASGYGDTQNPYASKTAKYFLAAPNAANGVPTFRGILASDVPILNQNTTGQAATLTTARTLTIGSTGKTFNGGADVSWSLAEIGAQPTLVSGTNIKTINNTSILGSGDLAVQPTLVSGTNIKTVNGQSLLGSENITLSSNAVRKSISSETTSPRAVFISPDGLNLFITGYGITSSVFKYTLSEPWNLYTISYTGDSYTLPEVTPLALTFSSDGTKMYVVGLTDLTIYQYDLSTAWLPSTATLGSSFNISALDSFPVGLSINPDGSKIHLLGGTNNTIREITLGTAYSLVGATHTATSITVDSNCEDMCFSDGGYKLFVLASGTTGYLESYTLTTPYDISTMTRDIGLFVHNLGYDPRGLFIKPDGTCVYSVDTYIDEVRQLFFSVPNRVESIIQPNNSINILSTSWVNDTLLVNEAGNIVYQRNNDMFIPHPPGGAYTTTAATVTGSIAVRLPTTTLSGINDMLTFWVDIYDYNTSGNVTSILVSGYVASTGWGRSSAMLLTNTVNGDLSTVYFCKDATGHYVCIAPTTYVWEYPQIVVRDVKVGYSGGTVNYDDNPWFVDIVTTMPTVSSTETATLIAAETQKTWKTARTLTIGNTGKSVNGGADVSWSLAEIGAGDVTTTGTQTLTNKTITGLKETKVVLAASNIDIALGNFFTKTISVATTLTVSNVPASGTTASFILELTNAGSATITWWSGMTWAAGAAPVLTTAGVDVLGFYTHDGGTTWRGLVLAKDIK